MYAHIVFTRDAQNNRVPADGDSAPYPADRPYRKRKQRVPWASEYDEDRDEDYRKKHKGTLGAGVSEIGFKTPYKRVCLGGDLEHTTDANGDIRLLDAEFWGRNLKSYKKRLAYLQDIYEIVSMSSDIAKNCMGDAYMAACPANQTSYKGVEIPLAIRSDCTPDLMRCLPPRGEVYAKGYAKSIWLLERTSVAIDGDLAEFLGDIKHSDET